MDAPYVRFSRDRRGYENFFVVQSVSGRRGKVRQRVLYWFRTPPQVKIGREPFDESTRRALEAQYPGLRFDWERIRNTPIPPIQPEHWRERRLAERAARQLAAAEDAEAPAAESGESAQSGEPSEPSLAQASAAPIGAGPATELRRPRRRRRRRDRNTVGLRAETGTTAPSNQTGEPPPASTDSEGTHSAAPAPDSDGDTDPTFGE